MTDMSSGELGALSNCAEQLPVMRGTSQEDPG